MSSKICEFWGKEFNREFNLNMHLRIHTKETPFEWELWHKQFTQKGNMIQQIQKYISYNITVIHFV